MKLLIVGPSKLKYMPYARFYLDNIDCEKNEVHLSFWNRDLKSEDVSSYKSVILHKFEKFSDNNDSVIAKIIGYKCYRRFLKNILRSFQFDFIIVLCSNSGVIIYDELKSHFKNRFILDYRDSTYESRVRVFGRAVKNLCRMSTATFVSSDAFRRFLPEDCGAKIHVSHNLLEDSLAHREYEKTLSNRIRLSFWGFIRHYDVNKSLIDRISSDERFELHYYGREQKDALDLKYYSESIGATNIFFHGEYNPEDRYRFVKETDLIHNIYDGKNENMAMAMANKYYDSIIFRIPQVCQTGSFMGEMALSHSVGLVADPASPDFCDVVYTYYTSLNPMSFNDACDAELERILTEYKRGVEIIRNLMV